MTEHLPIGDGTIAYDVNGEGPLVVLAHGIADSRHAPDLIAGVIELAPFTRKQSIDLGGLVRVKRYRAGSRQVAQVILTGSSASWRRYLDLAMPVKPADWDAELARIEAKQNEPGRTEVLQAMAKSNPGDADAELANVACPVLIVEGSADPDWADPRAEGERILAKLPRGLGELVVIDGAGHYLHAQVPNRVLELALPFLAKTLMRG